jgi:hypothetical protein
MHDFTGPEHELMKMICVISKRWGVEDWAHNVEYQIWRDLHSDVAKSELTGKERAGLAELTLVVGGWPVWDEEAYRAEIVMGTCWKALYAAWIVRAKLHHPHHTP